MRRVAILGRGGAGKSCLAARLGDRTGIPVVELDKHFWGPGLEPTPHEEWAAIQRELVRQPAWIMDGDLGDHDAPEIRLAAADTVIVLDFPLWLCAWRAARRSPGNAEFWRWVLGYRRRSLPRLLAAIEAHGRAADLHVLRGPGAVDLFVQRLEPLP